MGIYNFDILIIGGGPAGISSGIYGARNGLSVAVIDTSIIGGQPINYLEIENYIGFPTIKGYELIEKFEEHLDKFNVPKFEMQEIINIDLLSNPKKIECKENVFYAKSIILACGAKPQKLNIKGEDEFIGRGVSYCAICDGAFYKDKEVIVVGGGNSAIEEAIYLTRFVKKVRIIHHRDSFRADKIIQERAKNNPKIEFVMNKKIIEILGENLVSKVMLEDTQTGENSILNTDGIFIYIGSTPNIENINSQIKQNKEGFIETDTTMQTSIEGVYAAGDIRNTPLKQVITAVSDGAIAAIYAAKYVEQLDTKKTSQMGGWNFLCNSSCVEG